MPCNRIEVLPGSYAENVTIKDVNDHAGASERDRVVVEAVPHEGAAFIGPEQSREGGTFMFIRDGP